MKVERLRQLLEDIPGECEVTVTVFDRSNSAPLQCIITSTDKKVQLEQGITLAGGPSVEEVRLS